MVALLIAGSATLVAAVGFATALPRRGVVAFWLAVALLAQTLALTGAVVAGLLLQNLTGTMLLAVAIIELLVAGVVASRFGRRDSAWRTRAGAARRTLASTLRDWPVAIGFVLILATLAWRGFLVLRLPIVDYDGWSYHLVFTDVWLQHHALTLVPQQPWTAGYPADGELLTTWFASFTGGDASVGFSSIALIPLGILAVIGLARSLGARPRTAALAGLVFGMTPALIAEAGTSYIDAGSVAAVLATWWLGVRVLRGDRHWTTGLLLGLAGGLALGTKATNLLLVSPILAVVGLVLLRDLVARWRADGPAMPSRGAIVACLAALVVPVVFLGGSWYLKNVLVYGNAFYPFAMAGLPGVRIFAELTWSPPQLERYPLIEQVLRSWIADWHIDRYLYNVRPGGLGRAWPIILVVGAGGFGLALKRRSFVLALLAVIPAVVTLIASPNPWYARYTLYLPALGLAYSALALDALRTRLRTVAGLVLVGIAAVSLAYANIRPNIDVAAAFAGDSSQTPRQYLSLLLDPSDARRDTVNLRQLCSALSAIPADATVTQGGFGVLHGVAALDPSSSLTDPISGPISPAALVAQLRALGSGWLVTTAGNDVDLAAQGAGAALVDRGPICEGGRLWQVRAP